MTIDQLISLGALIVSIIGAVWGLAAYIGGKIDGLRNDMREDVSKLSDSIGKLATQVADHDPRIAHNAQRLAEHSQRLNAHSERLHSLEVS